MGSTFTSAQMDNSRIYKWIEGTNDKLSDSPRSSVFEDVPLGPAENFVLGPSCGMIRNTDEVMLYDEGITVFWDAEGDRFITTKQCISPPNTHHDQTTSTMTAAEFPEIPSEEQATVQTQEQPTFTAATSSALESKQVSNVWANNFCWRSKNLPHVQQPSSNSVGPINAPASDDSALVWTKEHLQKLVMKRSDDVRDLPAQRVHFDWCSRMADSESQISSQTRVDVTDTPLPSETEGLLASESSIQAVQESFSGQTSQLLSGNPFELTPSESESTTMSPTSQHADIEIMIMKRAPSKNVKTRYAPPSSLPLDTLFGNTSESSDGFVDFQIPIFPYEHMTTRCRERSCPIKDRHEKGPYLHQGKLRYREGNIFGASNPPPEVWKAYDRMKGGNLEGSNRRDGIVVTNFAKFHFGQPSEWSPDGVDQEDKFASHKGSGFQQKMKNLRFWEWN